MKILSLIVNALALLHHLDRLRGRIFGRMSALMRERGLPTSALFMLGAVQRHAHPTEICRELGVPAPSVSRFLKELEAGGYVVRETVPEDLRRYRFRLTEQGRALQAEGRRCMEEDLDALLARLTPPERAELDRLLGLLAGGEGEGADG